ncbi:hypothetical protein L873DRAFT_1691121 [Choiromyces venosus 120613-1]|uniref:Uncharacterized protein n=1 Tax=Choiromyces venosus 120613-1 TaxID=1336337 RepID=A0A3N4JGA6_9PEZI|nr:hypothetical protein L873DRAFT_1691121 [Choiromyces venosus 120613-1]
MSILDDDSFEEYFDSSRGNSHADAECTAAKGRYDSCFFKSYNERYRVGEVRMDECKSLFNQYKNCLNKTLNPGSPPRDRSSPRVAPPTKRITDPDEAWKRMTSSK